jgi:hypothetical protein
VIASHHEAIALKSGSQDLVGVIRDKRACLAAFSSEKPRDLKKAGSHGLSCLDLLSTDSFRGGWCWEEVIFALTGSYKKKLTTHPSEILITKVPEHRLRRTL